MHPVKTILALILFLLSVTPSLAQEPIIYLPILFKEPADMISKSTIGLVVPSTGKNNVLNPSGEIAGNHSAQGSATVSRVTTTQKYGLYSYSVISTGIGDGLNLTLLALENSANYAMFRVNNPQAARFNVTIGSATKEALFIESIDRDWSLYAIIFTATESSGQTNLRITQLDSGTKTFYIDGAHVQPVASDFSGKPTYIDGTQEGCRWLGAPHASASIRSADSRAGGLVKSFWEGYGFFPEKAVGMGTNVEELNIDSYMFLPGGELNSSKIPVREFSIIGYFLGDTLEELHEQAQALELVLALGTYPGNQPVRLRYFGAAVQKEISANYSGGLEGDLPIFYDDDVSQQDGKWVKNEKFKMQASINFVALDPFWYGVGERAKLLDTNDVATFRTVAARLLDTGQWSTLGPPSAGGTYTSVYAIAEDATYIYLGGDFDNFNGIAAADNIVRYEKQTGIYSAMHNGLNGDVNSIVIAANGDVIVGGYFTNASGVADADYITVWAVGASAFAAMGAPGSLGGGVVGVLDLFYDPDGLLWIGGIFTDWAGIANADNIVTWTGSAYAAPAVGANDAVTSFAHDGTYLYVGGSYSTIGGVAIQAIASWDGSDYAAVGDAITGTVYDVTVWNNQVVIGRSASPYVSILNGQIWAALGGSGANAEVLELSVGHDGNLFLAGAFTAIGAYNLADRVAKFNGYSFAHLDISLPDSMNVQVIYPSKYDIDPIIDKIYTLYLGFGTANDTPYAGTETVQNQGTTSVFPKIIFNRSGGTSALLETVRNERTGRELLFDYSLLNGESLTIDLNPNNRTIVSSFFGDRMDARLANDDFSVWQLLPGDNNISSLVVESGSPTVVGYILYREPYKSWN